jgi:linoleoyl-CoA desaturase|tara:strand:+ start:40 stop:1146 length:1107 start_codon:yes stop_codon:yes gene_type:complete
MNKLKFTKDKGSDFYKELNEKIEQYFSMKKIPKTGNNIMVFKIIMYFTLDILFYGLMITSNSIFEFYTFYLLMGLSILLTAFNISHDASHGVAVKSKYWNKILFSISFNLQGNNAYVWGKNHNESHHLYTNIEGSDIDVLNNPILRMTSSQPLKAFHKYQHLYAPVLSLLYSINWFFIREFLMLLKKSSRTITIKMPLIEVIKLILFKFIYIGYMFILPLYMLPFGFNNVLLVFILNHFMVSIIFTSVLGVSHLSDFVEHPIPDKEGKLLISWPTLQMCTSVDYHAKSTFLNWTLGGFNAHALHHILPNISHVHYLNILPIFIETANKHGVNYMNMSYNEAYRSYYRFLYKMGHQQTLKPLYYEGTTS